MFSEETSYYDKVLWPPNPARIVTVPREKLYDLANKCVNKLEADVTSLKEDYVRMRVFKLTRRWLFKLSTETARAKATKEFEALKLSYVIGYDYWRILVQAKSYLDQLRLLDWPSFEVCQANINAMRTALSSAEPYESYVRRIILTGSKA
jgi:hypothetical protein